MSAIDIKDHERITNVYAEQSAFRYLWSALGGVLLLVMVGTVLVIYGSIFPASAAPAAGGPVRDHVAIDFSGNGYSGQIATVGLYRGETGIPKDHNGSDVLVFEKAGLIVYAKPKAAMERAVRPGDVLFRGTFSKTGVRGVAYAFKTGCTPVPYTVSLEGKSIGENSVDFKGAAPVWSKTSCDVVAFSEKVPNAKLTFGWIPGDEVVEN